MVNSTLNFLFETKSLPHDSVKFTVSWGNNWKVAKSKNFLFCFYVSFALRNVLGWIFCIVVVYQEIKPQFFVIWCVLKSPRATWRPPSLSRGLLHLLSWWSNHFIQIFEERVTPVAPWKNLSEQSREPTNSTHLNHVGGRRMLSPIHQSWGLFLKSPATFWAWKVICETKRICLLWNMDLWRCFQDHSYKTKQLQVSWLETFSFWRYKVFYVN